MTTAQLITELEKPRKNYPQGVLTWEKGDVALFYDSSYIVTIVLPKSEYRHREDGKIRLTLYGYGYEVRPEHCTHSADDPRLLGWVLRELENDITHFKCPYYDHRAQRKWIIFYVFGKNRGYEAGETLLEAALKALLAKVEGEQDA